MKILLLQLKRIGDLILTTPAIAALRQSFPQAQLTLVVSQESAELLPAISNVERILIARRNLRDLALFSSVATRRFDYCIDFTRNDRSASLALLSCARRRVVSYRVREQSKTRSHAYTDFVGVRMRDMHTIDYNLALLEPLRASHAPTAPHLDLPQIAYEKADALRSSWKVMRPYIIVHPGSARQEKLWEPGRWADVIDYFDQNNGFDFVLTSGPSRDEQTHIAASDLVRPNQPIPLATKGKPSCHFTGKISHASDGVFTGPAARPNESNLDGSGHRCYGFAAGHSFGNGTFMSRGKTTKKRLSFWQTLKAASGPYRRLYSYVRPYKVRFILGLLLGFAYGGVNSLLPLATARVTSTIFHGAAPNPMALRSNLGVLDTGPKVNSIVLICLAIPAIMALRSLCSYGNSYCMQWVSNKVVTDLRAQLFNKMVRLSMDFFNRMRSGLLISRITNETRVVQMALTAVSSDIFKQPVTIVGAIAVLLLMDWKFTVVTLILFPTCLLPLRYYGRRARKAMQGQFEGMGEMVVTMQETFAGIRVIKSFAREAHQEKAFKRSNQLQFSQMMRIIRAMEATGPLVEIIAAIGVGLALLYVYAANLSAGRFFGLITGIFILYDPIKTLSKIQIVMQNSIAATSAIFSVLDSEPSVRDAPDAIELTSATGRIDFQNLTFRYVNTVTDAVSNLNLQIEAGKTYALVGASGAGKSTILSLILRLYDPTSGAVKIDGHDLRSITQKSLREQLGLVTQETFLFHDTIFNNILFGRLHATPEEIYEAAKAAYAHDFIMAQPKGYETVIGDKGCLLSGGQQQRLAIARAILKNAPILLLDEATSSLDSESEKQIQKALAKLATGRTVIAIAHRLSTVLSADQIIVMDSGHIKEIGTHAQLLEKSGYYRRLYDHQFNRIPEESGAEAGFLVEELV